MNLTDNRKRIELIYCKHNEDNAKREFIKKKYDIQETACYLNEIPCDADLECPIRPPFDYSKWTPLNFPNNSRAVMVVDDAYNIYRAIYDSTTEKWWKLNGGQWEKLMDVTHWRELYKERTWCYEGH